MIGTTVKSSIIPYTNGCRINTYQISLKICSSDETRESETESAEDNYLTFRWIWICIWSCWFESILVGYDASFARADAACWCHQVGPLGASTAVLVSVQLSIYVVTVYSKHSTQLPGSAYTSRTAFHFCYAVQFCYAVLSHTEQAHHGWEALYEDEKFVARGTKGQAPHGEK